MSDHYTIVMQVAPRMLFVARIQQISTQLQVKRRQIHATDSHAVDYELTHAVNTHITT